MFGNRNPIHLSTPLKIVSVAAAIILSDCTFLVGKENNPFIGLQTPPGYHIVGFTADRTLYAPDAPTPTPTPEATPTPYVAPKKDPDEEAAENEFFTCVDTTGGMVASIAAARDQGVPIDIAIEAAHVIADHDNLPDRNRIIPVLAAAIYSTPEAGAQLKEEVIKGCSDKANRDHPIKTH
jgi:hypothetical protein